MIMERSQRRKVPSACQIESYASQGSSGGTNRSGAHIGRNHGPERGGSGKSNALRDEVVALKITEGRSKNPYIAVVAPSSNIEAIPLTSICNEGSISLHVLQNASIEESDVDPFNIGIDFSNPSVILSNACQLDQFADPELDGIFASFVPISDITIYY